MLNQIQAVYDAVDHQQINEQSHALDKWLWQFRDAVEGAEDVLDEIDYYKLEEEAGVHNLELEVAKYTSEGNMVKNLRLALTRLDETAAGVGTFLHLTSRYGSALLPDHAEEINQETSSTLVATEIFGRDTEKNEVHEVNSPHNGSRILLTTRMTSVADMVTSVMQSNNNYMNLNGLDEYHNFMMFKKYAFYGMKTEDYEHLLPLAENIAKKFQGCPLVTKIASEHLRSNKGQKTSEKDTWCNWQENHSLLLRQWEILVANSTQNIM
ncbi:hypothetical protein OsI_12724 [Oryza sativa Indica Group]|uniref:Disease resistance N-terminal domain-containing protein n=1 Tax=Oryza sativa subsp. indica TaxID=39946 RepID=B8AN24_ORYSI|nr:hypothetical protein OsI_12724 [Oryza sativa Indica Group]